MKTRMSVSMAYPYGLVLFDPQVLLSFLVQHGLQDCQDLLAAFQQDEAVGDTAVASGVIVAMYPVEEDDCVFVNLDAEAGHVDEVDWQFVHSGLPLQVTSGVLVAADIFTLVGWERQVFDPYQRRQLGLGHSWPSDDLDVPLGKHVLTVRGGRARADDSRVYGLHLQPVAVLPAWDATRTSDSLDFNIR